jgi:hypothetical protein
LGGVVDDDIWSHLVEVLKEEVKLVRNVQCPIFKSLASFNPERKGFRTKRVSTDTHDSLGVGVIKQEHRCMNSE